MSPSGALPLCDGGLVCSRRSSACGLGFSRCSSACERSLRVRKQCRRVWFPRRLSARGAAPARPYASQPSGLVHPAVDTLRAQPFEHSISHTPGTWQARFQKTLCSNLGSLGHANSPDPLPWAPGVAPGSRPLSLSPEPDPLPWAPRAEGKKLEWIEPQCAKPRRSLGLSVVSCADVSVALVVYF